MSFNKNKYAQIIEYYDFRMKEQYKYDSKDYFRERYSDDY
ncbi:MAG: hypothetical protein BAJALOKI3v1_200051 [Promethearchaeota archaeon]|nr:MAG: hypothetical protein BAJALOKI3v1_200051 [Candidatus Lokiarchaeota archaeon]